VKKKRSEFVWSVVALICAIVFGYITDDNFSFGETAVGVMMFISGLYFASGALHEIWSEE
jgi:hypothetical protein